MIRNLRDSGLLDDTAATQFARAGHFVYESGAHGDLWLALDLLFADPQRLRQAATQLADKLIPHAPEVVCAPLLGGALVGQWVAHELNATFAYAEPQPGPPTSPPTYAVPRQLRPMLRGKRAIVVDDAINIGFASLACLREIEAAGGSVAAVAALLVRTPGVIEQLATRRLKVESLVGVEWNTWPAAECPLCRSGLPIESPD